MKEFNNNDGTVETVMDIGERMLLNIMGAKNEKR